jgi:hypothetical protein
MVELKIKNNIILPLCGVPASECILSLEKVTINKIHKVPASAK